MFTSIFDEGTACILDLDTRSVPPHTSLAVRATYCDLACSDKATRCKLKVVVVHDIPMHFLHFKLYIVLSNLDL
jgi:hypothetical protein